MPEAENILVDTIKPADEEENALVVRVYEALGRSTRTHFHVNSRIREVLETDMLEDQGKPISPDSVSFGPFEIKTFLLRL